MAFTILFTMVSIGVFLFFVDQMGKSLRPVAISARLAEFGTKVIETTVEEPIHIRPDKHANSI